MTQQEGRLPLPTDRPLVVVTDLDGSLLDHHNYSWLEAQPALTLLHNNAIPLVLNSSKTAAEIVDIRKALNNTEPYITENGGGIFPDETEGGNPVVIGMERQLLLQRLHQIREGNGYRFIGFADMTTDEIQKHTGLDKTSAEAAGNRDFTEPLLWQDTESNLEKFIADLKRNGLHLVRGGRFYHVSAPADKSRAFPWLTEHYRSDSGNAPYFIALGDGNNDVAMLEASDQPVLLKSPVNALPEVKHPGTLIPEGEGPGGWNQAILSLLSAASETTSSNSKSTGGVYG